MKLLACEGCGLVDSAGWGESMTRHGTILVVAVRATVMELTWQITAHLELRSVLQSSGSVLQGDAEGVIMSCLLSFHGPLALVTLCRVYCTAKSQSVSVTANPYLPLAAPFCSDCCSEQTHMKDLLNILRQVSFPTQPGLKPSASGLWDTEHRATAPPSQWNEQRTDGSVLWVKTVLEVITLSLRAVRLTAVCLAYSDYEKW